VEEEDISEMEVEKEKRTIQPKTVKRKMMGKKSVGGEKKE